MIDDVRLNTNKKVIMMSNLSFDHPLSNIELIELQNLLTSGIPLAQIYFKDNIDIDTIEKVKLLLEGLPNINDAIVEKYIMKDISEIEKEKIINMNFLNIDSWNVSYFKDGNKYSITSLSKYRKIEEWFKSILYELDNDNLSLLDKVCMLYDKVKMLEFSTDVKYDRIPEIVNDGRATAYGYNLIFKEVLNLCGVASIIGKMSNVDEDNYVTLAIINDNRYNLSGIYVFDPSMDTIFKDQYKNNLARKMNYNFFGVTIEKLKKIYIKRNMQGFLKLLASDDVSEFNHFVNLYQLKNGKEEIDKIERTFGLPLECIYNKSYNTNEISSDIMLNIMTKSLEKYPSDIINKDLLTKVISDNYVARDSELFTGEYVKKICKVDN